MFDSSKLLGLTITGVRPISKEECEWLGWEPRASCTAIDLSDGSSLFASVDPEGNRPGALLCYDGVDVYNVNT